MNQERQLNILAGNLDEILEEIYERRMGFAVLVFDFNAVGMGDYVSNAERKDMIVALREAADRLEKNEVIPVAIGEA